MKRVEEPNTVFYYQDKLVKVIGINPGHKSIIMQYLEAKDCPKCCKCGEPFVDYQFDIIEDSLIFQEGAKPVDTLEQATDK